MAIQIFLETATRENLRVGSAYHVRNREKEVYDYADGRKFLSQSLKRQICVIGLEEGAKRSAVYTEIHEHLSTIPTTKWVKRGFSKQFLKGFTLLELMVVVTLLAIFVAIAVPSLRSLTGLDLKKEITTIGGLTSEVYNMAALSGKTHRIVFDLDNHVYWVEERDTSDIKEITPELGYEDLMKRRDEEGESDDPLQEFLPKFKAVSDTIGEKTALPKDVAFYGVWTDQMIETARSGQVAIYFFSGGYTQPAFVSLSLKDALAENAMYLALSPLTGEISTGIGEPDINQLLSSEREQ